MITHLSFQQILNSLKGKTVFSPTLLWSKVEDVWNTEGMDAGKGNRLIALHTSWKSSFSVLEWEEEKTGMDTESPVRTECLSVLCEVWRTTLSWEQVGWRDQESERVENFEIVNHGK
jgi:hypothetical protein